MIKFYLVCHTSQFSLLLKPLFETYKKAMEGTTREIFVDAVGKWVEENLSLVNLRPLGHSRYPANNLVCIRRINCTTFHMSVT
jgi:hypothetical protein